MSFPDRQRAPASTAPSWAFLIAFVMACGASPAAEELDAGLPDAACECPTPPTLTAETVKHVPQILMLGSRNRLGQGMYCDDGDIAIGGSCAYRGTEPGMRLMYSGDIGVPEYPHTWWCGWYNLTQNRQDLDTTVICLTPQANSPSPAGCNCPEYQPLADRITRVTQRAPFQSYSANEITVACPPGSILLTGGCAYQGLFVGAVHDMTLSRSGFATDDTNTWQCAWNSPIGTSDEQMLATAYCLQPPDYGPDPLESRIALATETTNIPANGSASITASCAPGDYLLAGSCMLDSQEPASHQAIIYHHGFDTTDSDTWRCTWNNPTALTLPATAVATCVNNSIE